MKHLKYSFFIVLGALIFSGCEKNTISFFPTTTNDGKANVKIVHASAYPTNTAVQLKVNGTRVSNNITYSTPYPGGGLNTGGSNMPWYMFMEPGNNTISMSYPKAGSNVDSITLYTTTINVTANKYYTAYIFDTLSTTQSLLVEENVARPDTGKSRFKFVNLMPNLPAADLYFGSTKVASNIAYKAVSPEFELPFRLVDRWYIRPAGAAPTSTATAVYPATTTAAMTIPDRRVFTVYSRGRVGGTGTMVPAISLLYN